MSWFSVERGPQPIYLQVGNRIKELICTGALPPGTKIPSSRALAKALSVSRNSVLEAYARLTSEGILESNGKAGTYVSRPCVEAARAALRTAAPATGRHRPDSVWEQALSDSPSKLRAAPPGVILPAREERGDPLSGPVLGVDRLSAERFRMCLNYVLANNPHHLLGSEDTDGYAPLREWVASHMRSRGVAASAEEVLIVGGFQQGLALVCSTFLKAGETVLVENPGHPATLASLMYAGALVEGVEMSLAGIDTGQLWELTGRSGPRMLCVTPLWQNPTGITMDARTRKEILACADSRDLIVVEDAFADELCYAGHLIPPLKAEDRAGRVIYIETISKILFPGLRLGWLVAPKPAIRALAQSKRAAALYATPVLEAAYYEFCRQGYLESHIVRMRKLYGRLRDAMVEALTKHMPAEVAYHVGEAGASAWVTLPEGMDSGELYEEARAAGAWFVPGREFFVGGGGGRNLRLTCYSPSEEVIAQGVKTLAELVYRRMSEARQSREEGHEAGVIESAPWRC